jgi:hypothetical protein
MAETFLVIFDTFDEAMKVRRDLKNRGFSPSAVTLMSAEPTPAIAGEGADSRIGLFSVAGGVLGAVGGLLLTVLTSRSANLITGGLPIVTPWAFGIVVFETTALGAILATLARMIYEAGLASCVRFYPEEIAEGKIALEVVCADGRVRALAEEVIASSKAKYKLVVYA